MESNFVWIAGITIGIDVMSVVQSDTLMEQLTDELLNLPDAKAVEGPFINGMVAVTFEAMNDTADILRMRAYNVGKEVQEKNSSTLRRTAMAGGRPVARETRPQATPRM